MPVGPNPGARRRPPRRRPGIRGDPPERSWHRPLDCQRMGGRPFLFGTLSARLWRLRSLRAGGPVRAGARDTAASDADGFSRKRYGRRYLSIVGRISGSARSICTKISTPPPTCPRSRLPCPLDPGYSGFGGYSSSGVEIICVCHHALIEAWRCGRPVCATSPRWSRPFRRISIGTSAWATTKWPPDGSARRSCSRIGCWDAVSIRRRRPCEPILPHGSSARFCANGRRPMPDDS